MKILVEQCQKIKINELVRDVKVEMTMLRLKEKIQLLDQEVGITYTKCNFGGQRFWFVCPLCDRRIGVLYKNPISEAILCRKCHGLRYMKSSFHKMK